MAHTITKAIAILSLFVLSGSGIAAAATDGPTCRAACAPRIEEQCGQPGVRGFRKCRRQLVRACKRTTPESACPSTAAFTRELEGRRLGFAAGESPDGTNRGTSLELTLCSEGRLLLSEQPSFTFAPLEASGTWAVHLSGGGLVLELDVEDEIAPRRFGLARDPEGAIRLDGRQADVSEAGDTCPAEQPDDDTPGNPNDPGDPRTAPVVEALTDRSLTIGRTEFFSSGTITETQDMTLCGSGRFTLVVTTVTATSIGDFAQDFDSQETFAGTWTVRRVDGTDVLELATGEAAPRRLPVAVEPDGTIVLDGLVADVSDARGQCTTVGGPNDRPEPEPGDPLAEATRILADRVLVLEETNTGFGRRTTAIVLCASGRYLLESSSSIVFGAVTQSIGGWRIRHSGIGLSLVLEDDVEGLRDLSIAVDAEGNLLLNGLAVSEGDPSLVDGTCPQL